MKERDKFGHLGNGLRGKSEEIGSAISGEIALNVFEQRWKLIAGIISDGIVDKNI